MKLTRRNLLLAGLGATQVGLLDRLGIPSLGLRSARAATGNGPTKLLTIFMKGGWMPSYFFSPLRLDEVETFIPAPRLAIPDESQYYVRRQVEKNLDGSAAVDVPGAKHRPIRVPRVWDDAALAAGQADPRNPHPVTGQPTSPHGWAWVKHKLWENTVVVHGLDMGTAAHNSGLIGAMSGYSGPTYRAPSMNAVIANHFLDHMPDRVIPAAVVVGEAGNRMALRAASAPMNVASPAQLQANMSESSVAAWANIREPRTGEKPSNMIEDWAMSETKALYGKTSNATDLLLEKLYDGYAGVSKLLARDVVSLVGKTKGVEFSPQPYWAPSSGYFSVDLGSIVRNYDSDYLQMALTLLKSDVCSAVSTRILPPIPAGGGGFDTHGGESLHWTWLYASMDMVGRLVGEMKVTPSKSDPNKTLLDETLVMVISEFGRTWPISGTSDHWPHTSVAFIGGNYLGGNRMIGGYDVAGRDPASVGFEGLPIELIDETGNRITRKPTMSDVVYTVYKLFGADQFLQGGPGEIVGVRAG